MKTIELLDRPVYGLTQVDGLLSLRPGTSRRWIAGYVRSGKTYPPIVRVDATDSDLVTWGEFVETRLLAEYRDRGVATSAMRQAIEKLREAFNTRYPLAHARPFLDVQGRELVRSIQEQVGLERRYHVVVVRNNQVMLSPSAEHFVNSAEFGDDATNNGVVERLHPMPNMPRVVMDPLRQFGDPVVRSVPTRVIAEQVRAGDRIEVIAELYELDVADVEAALRFELRRTAGDPAAA